MKHIIFGGDGFVGRHLAEKLVTEGHEVVVADVVKSDLAHYAKCTFLTLDVTKDEDFKKLKISPDDIIYNMSAKMLAPIVAKSLRYDFFYPVNYFGAKRIIEKAAESGATRIVQFTTDMIYGHTIQNPQDENHPCAPIGHYGGSKYKTEQMCEDWRAKGMNISIFRPRLIIGPGRLGILEKLFKLIDNHLPVPMIGSGKVPYQFVSVFDCADAAYLAWKNNVPNEAYNLGSDNPPSVRELLGDLIKHAGSRSLLIPTPGFAVKATLDLLDLVNMPLMDPEQYKIADEMCVRDCTKAKGQLGWEPKYRDKDMLNAAYSEYREGLATSS